MSLVVSWRPALMALLAGMALGAADCSRAESGPTWQQLSPPQRSALAPLEHDWSSIDAGRKQKWVDIANRFPRMSGDERERIQGRMRDWAQLSPAERGEARLRYQQSRSLTPQERQQRWEDYRALPPERREELAKLAAPAPRQAASGLARRAPLGPGESKSTLVRSPADARPTRPVAPTVVQGQPGATTTLMSRQPAPPTHQQPGLPKIAVTPGFVDRNTLLPQTGPQAAAIRSSPAASGPASRVPDGQRR